MTSDQPLRGLLSIEPSSHARTADGTLKKDKIDTNDSILFSSVLKVVAIFFPSGIQVCLIGDMPEQVRSEKSGEEW